MPAKIGRLNVGSLFAVIALGALAVGCECGSGGDSQVCSLQHPEYCYVEDEVCSPDWMLEISPSTGDVTQGTRLSISSNLNVTDATRLEAAIFYELTLTDAADVSDTVAGRYLSPLVLDRGGVASVRARYSCDPADTFRAAATLTVVPEGNLELTPPPGSYRTQVEVMVKIQPSNLQVYIDLLGSDIGTVRQESRSVMIPPTGLFYDLQVTATDGYGHVVTKSAGRYLSDPFTPEVVAVSGTEYVNTYEVFMVQFDRKIVDTIDPYGRDYFYHVPAGPYAVRLYPKRALPQGPLVLNQHLAAFGEGGSAGQLDPQALLSTPRQVCACDSARLSITYPGAYEHFLMSPPTTIAVESSVPLDPLSLILTAETLGSRQQVQISSADIKEQNGDGTYFVLWLDGANLVLGGYYTLTVNANSLHPLDRDLEARVEFSTELPSYLEALDVTSASGYLVANHAVQVDAGSGWAWFGGNPGWLAPVSDTAYTDATMTVVDVAGTAVIVTLPTQYPNQDTSSVYRTLSVWPSNGPEYIHNWSKFAFLASYRDRDRSSMLLPVSAEVVFDDGRSYAMLPVHRTATAFKMALPEGFHDYPATMATLHMRFSFDSATQGLAEFDVAVTYIVDSGQLSPHFVRDSWSWFGLTDTDTAAMDVLSGGISVLYGDAVSSVTLEVSSPLPATTLVLDSTDASRWTVAADASLSPVTQGGAFPGTLRMRDTMGVLLDQMDVPLLVAPVRFFANAPSATVDQSMQDTYVLQWNAPFDPLYVVALLYIQVFSGATVDCAGPAEPSVMQLMWPADAPQVYVPIANLDPGLYSICASVLVGDSYEGSGLAMQQTKLVFDVQ